MTAEATHSLVALTVNGEQLRLDIENRETLLDVLRERLDLTGAKRACDRGECGACTVLIDGKPAFACSLLGVQMKGRTVDTIEGLAKREDFARLLDAFVREDGGQCGFCVPGFAVAAYAALGDHPGLDATGLRWELVGHICRCNAYDRIAKAVDQAVKGAS